jgi:hypothetical protein
MTKSRRGVQSLVSKKYNRLKHNEYRLIVPSSMVSRVPIAPPLANAKPSTSKLPDRLPINLGAASEGSTKSHQIG